MDALTRDQRRDAIFYRGVLNRASLDLRDIRAAVSAIHDDVMFLRDEQVDVDENWYDLDDVAVTVKLAEEALTTALNLAAEAADRLDDLCV